MTRAMFTAILMTWVLEDLAHGADGGARPRFEVASVRLAIRSGSYAPRRNPGRVIYERVTLLTLLSEAYGVKTDQISGPGWLATEYYSVSATFPPNTTGGQFNLMLQDLLAERFHLTLYHATREFPAYELVVASGGHKMKPSSPDVPATAKVPAEGSLEAIDRSGLLPLPPGAPASVVFGGGMVRSRNRVTMAEFAATLGPMLNISEGRVLAMDTIVPRVIEKTGLRGKFEFSLEFAGSIRMPGFGQKEQPPTGTIPVGDPAGPSLFTALRQQLGLELKKGKTVSLDLLVIKHVDKVPTEN